MLYTLQHLLHSQQIVMIQVCHCGKFTHTICNITDVCVACYRSPHSAAAERSC